MTREDIIRMAQEAGFVWLGEYHSNLEDFAKLVAQHERERIKQANAPEIERINAHIKEALTQPEPVAWEQFYPDMGKPKLAYLSPTESSENACFTPPQRTWVGLTDEEMQSIAFESADALSAVFVAEAKLKEKNT